MKEWCRIAAVVAALAAPAAAAACGADSDCAVPGGTYRIDMPADAAPGHGAVMFAHGYRGTAAGTMQNVSLRDMAKARGLALIALDAGADDWNVPDAPDGSRDGRDEMTYIDAVAADAAARFGIDRTRIYVTGFSAGGMFVWNVICTKGDAYAGYVPYSGTFWKGPPPSCPAPAQNVIHIHGTTDTTVPMAGRAIAETRQGSVPEALAMYGTDKGMVPGAGYAMADLTCTHAANPAGKRLDLCLFDGAHSFTAERLGAAIDMLTGG